MIGREQYIKDVKAGKLLPMMTIIHENKDMSLFKYTPSLEHCMDMIINERVYMSSASEFNDPFDSLPAYQRIKLSEQEDKWRNAYKNAALHQKALERQKTVKVACFSERVDSSIMWSHYADSHKGFCLEYKVKPGEIDAELRLYQSNEIIIHNPTVEDILPIMDVIIKNSKLIHDTKVREGWE